MKKIILFLFLIYFFINMAGFVSAEVGGWSLEIGVPGLQAGTEVKEPGQYLEAVFKFAVMLAAILAVVMIIAGGFLWMTSPAIGTKEKGKEMIYGAISGLILLLASYLILYTINPALTGLKGPNLQDININTSGGGGGTGGGGSGGGSGGGGGGGNHNIAQSASNYIGRYSKEFLPSDPRNACAAVVSTILMDNGALNTFEPSVARLANELYSEGWTTIITDPSQLQEGDVVFISPHPILGDTFGIYNGQSSAIGQIISSQGAEPYHVGIIGNQNGQMVFVNNSSDQGVVVGPPISVLNGSMNNFYGMVFALRR